MEQEWVQLANRCNQDLDQDLNRFLNPQTYEVGITREEKTHYKYFELRAKDIEFLKFHQMFM